MYFGEEDGFSPANMLNLRIVMNRLFALIIILFALFPAPAHAQNEGSLQILSPEAGQVLKGNFSISGTVTLLGFSSYELSFAYEDDQTQTWFVIASSKTPVYDGELGTWDTTTLTDGDYTLRLQATLLDGSSMQTTISGLRVRNYTAVPTETLVPTSTPVSPFLAPTAQLIAPVVITLTPSLPTPTDFPPNPAGLDTPEMTSALGRGALWVLLIFLGVALILRLRRD